MRGSTALLAAVLSTGIVGAPASAADDPDPRTCELTHTVEFFQRRSDLPPDIQDALAKVGDMAEAGETFNRTDFIEYDAPMKRFVLGGRSGTRWFVWYEHGGFDYHEHIVGWVPLYIRADETVPFLAADFGGEPCAGIEAFLSGVMLNIDGASPPPD